MRIHLRYILICFLIVLLWSLQSANGALSVIKKATNEEYQFKAAFVLNFSIFTKWPQGTLEGKTTFRIGTFNPLVYNAFKKTFINKNHIKVPYEIILIDSDYTKVKSCQVIFIDVTAQNIQAITQEVFSHNVLTVTDQYVQQNEKCMIQLMTIDNKLRFKVNRQAIKKANLIISSKLLRIAR